MTTGRFPYGLQAKYPHMMPEDIAVWERYVQANPRRFDTCDYDVRVGTGTDVPEGTPENLERMQEALSRKKIDVVGYAGDSITVIEVKPVANARALGQILTYVDLYRAEHPDAADVRGMLVAGDIERDMRPMFEKHGIELGIA